MKKLLIFLFISAFLYPVGVSIHTYERETFTIDFSAPELNIYQIASYITGCPERILRGIHFAESSYGANMNHPDPLDIGEFGLHEDPAYHAERAGKWGEYNAYCPLQSAIIAGHIYMENLNLMGNEKDAVAAYKQGRRGVRENGREEWYVDRVENYIKYTGVSA
jgi:hypothetical protein